MVLDSSVNSRPPIPRSNAIRPGRNGASSNFPFASVSALRRIASTTGKSIGFFAVRRLVSVHHTPAIGCPLRSSRPRAAGHPPGVNLPRSPRVPPSAWVCCLSVVRRQPRYCLPSLQRSVVNLLRVRLPPGRPGMPEVTHRQHLGGRKC